MTQQTTTAKQTESTQQQYAVGDKVRILGLSIFDANEIGKTGVVTDGNRELCIGGFGAVVALPNGYKRVYKYENIEKVAEQMAKKFNVGDTVRIAKNYDTLSGFNVGDIAQVSAAKHDGSKSGGYADYSVRNANSFGYCNAEHLELDNAKPTQSTPKKKARLSALEAQVAELTAKVEALEKAQKPAREIGVDFAYEPKLSANEQRKVIIAEAKAFVEDVTHRIGNGKSEYGEGNATFRTKMTIAKFYVNKEKRVVTALVYGKSSGRLLEKAIAKCAPDDVFNADIGKAIALGRALGLDVKRFEQAVKPTEFAVGHIVNYDGVNGNVTRRLTEIFGEHAETDGGTRIKLNGSSYGKVTITDDTDAQY